MSDVQVLRSTRTFKSIGVSVMAMLVLLTGLFGSVSSTQAAPQAAPANAGATIVSVAYKYNGYRYRYGGASPSGFDCSGFVYYVYKQAGISIGRDTNSQYNSGTRVGFNNLQPGDIVLFSNTYRRGLSHAAIYIGGGKIIHAVNENVGVTVSNLNSSYWRSHFTTGVRP
ncbi:MAG: C40 family peptidase [Chloroflexota bacterium]|nr:C40 family peptidase [Chloroflexota bacterium]